MVYTARTNDADAPTPHLRSGLLGPIGIKLVSTTHPGHGDPRLPWEWVVKLHGCDSFIVALQELLHLTATYRNLSTCDRTSPHLVRAQSEVLHLEGLNGWIRALDDLPGIASLVWAGDKSDNQMSWAMNKNHTGSTP